MVIIEILTTEILTTEIQIQIKGAIDNVTT